MPSEAHQGSSRSRETRRHEGGNGRHRDEEHRDRHSTHRDREDERRTRSDSSSRSRKRSHRDNDSYNDERDRPRHRHRHRGDEDHREHADGGSSSSRAHRDRDRHRDDRDRPRHRESSTERRERKALKRAQKLQELEQSLQQDDDAAAQRTAVAELMMYSAEDNPFNDANLGQKFTWGKKVEKERQQGLTREEAEKRDAQRRQEAMAEIEKLNAKRAERERQAAIREEEEARMARLQESAQMAGWVAKEDDFHLEQAKRRAVIRVKENRARPIDLLSINLKWANPEAVGDGDQDSGNDATHRKDHGDDDDEAGLEIDLEEPYNIFENLTIDETKELREDIDMYLSLEKNQANLDFWKAMVVVCDDKLEELHESEGAEQGSQFMARSRADPEERSRINAMLSNKSSHDLEQLRDQVSAKLASDEPLDVEYWERVLLSIRVWTAKAALRDMHEAVLSNRLEHLRRKQRDEAVRQQQDLLQQMTEDGYPEEGQFEGRPNVEESATAATAEPGTDARVHFYDADEMEPPPLDAGQLGYEDRRLPISTVREDLEKLVAARRRVVGALFIPRQGGSHAVAGEGEESAADRMFMQEASKALDVEEEVFKGDEVLTNQTYQWEDKYRPRKPRYFNRVHTGFEWNKYNQTHYDSDNPPPKTVQGYKFNIFYPDLIDKTVAPTYKIIKEPGNQDTVLLRFSAGPPYEDIAFRVVNREWEYSHKRGFRNSFDRGVLQLHFNFKRLRYRK
ncbi:hypothetical protein BCV70DRAFT_231508 [Testicularia cyperi]|uniref:Splicing factor Cactin n=1 Tax=Testicularia cyperi TaxID=1882483 RepID=A0A317XQP0_9BASI|nr:hypothetical protein BCV70DRAFT_231508 [Testicularia cyperi]